MRETDVVIRDAAVEFEDVILDPPLVIAGREIASCTLATARVTAVDTRGHSAVGHGATILSIPWAWPRSRLPVPVRDRMLRVLAAKLADAATELPASDPLRAWYELSRSLDGLTAQVAGSPDSTDSADSAEPIPRLAAMLALGAVDNALHDGWARAAGRSAYRMYTTEFLTDDLADMLGPEFADAFPGDFLIRPRRQLPIQHLLSATDPLGPPQAAAGGSLATALVSEGIRHVKVKVLGQDPHRDAERLVDVHRVARQFSDGSVSLAIDPNEGYGSARDVVELLTTVRRSSPAAAAAIGYVEQPVPRDVPADPAELRAAGALAPILMDEGLSTLEALRGLPDAGWGGLVIKAAKGQTPALLAHSFAHVHGLFVTIQDLTAVDLALQHSMRLASVLDLSAPHLEYNSRQYVPGGNRRLLAAHPDLVTVRSGHVQLDDDLAPGLY